MGLFRDYLNQTRKPEGILGRLMLEGMNPGHAKPADWGMTFLPPTGPETVADLGCGGGRNIGELLKRYPRAKGTAVDHSALSVEKAGAYNRALVGAGRLTVLTGDVSALPLPSEGFDLVTAFETVYFWPGLARCFAEVARILRPGGCFLICNESDGTDQTSLRFERIIDGMKNYTGEELSSALQAAGFAEITVSRHAKKPWIAVLAKKGRPAEKETGSV